MRPGVSRGGSVKIKIEESETGPLLHVGAAAATRAREKQILKFYAATLSRILHLQPF